MTASGTRKTPAGSRAGAGTRAVMWSSVVVALVLNAGNFITPGDPTGLMRTLGTTMAIAVGAMLVVRVPGNAVGWLLWLGGLLTTLSLGLSGIAAFVIEQVGNPPGAIWLAWLGAWTDVLGLLVLGALLPLVFPTGRLLSPRWRLAVVVGIGSMTLQGVAAALGPGTSGDSYPPGFANPLLVTGPAASLVDAIGAIGQNAGGFALAAGVLSVVLRFRRSTGVERQQLKWFASAASVVVLAIVAAVAMTAAGESGSPVVQAIWFVAFLGLAMGPLSIGIAVLRYRLYDIDRLVSRTIGYAVTSLAIVACLAASIVLLEAVLARVTQGQTVAVAASTLVAAAASQPIRRRVQRSVDRRFDRARYDADRTAAAFAARLRLEVDLAAPSRDLARTVAGSLAPASVGLWLRRPAEARAPGASLDRGRRATP